MGRRTKTIVRLIAVLVAVATAGAGGAAYASHQFSDVATGTFFHEPVDAIVDAGCATGYTDGTFRPNDNASRGQFAFWVSNCAGRAGHASQTSSALVSDPNTADFATGPEATVATLAVEVGGATGAGQNQFVTLIGDATAYSNETATTFCGVICNAYLRVYEGATLVAETFGRMQTDFGSAELSLNATIPADNGPHTYTLRAATFNGQGIVVTNGSLSAVVSTFGSTGADTLSSGGGAAPRAGGDQGQFGPPAG